MFIKLAKLAAVLALTLATAACETPMIMSARATTYNVAVADTSNQLLLLNALRASQRLPTYYTRLEGDTSLFYDSGNYQQSGSIGRDIAKKGVGYIAGLTGTTQNSLTLGTLDDQKFMRGVLSPVPLNELGFFMGQGWPPELLFSMTISKITVTRGEVRHLVDSFEKNCRDQPAGDYCNGDIPEGLTSSAPQQYVAQQMQACVDSVGVTMDPSRDGRDSDSITFLNYPPDIAQMKCFQWALRLVIALQPELKSTSTEETVVENVPAGENPGEAVSSLLASKYDVVFGAGVYNVCQKHDVAGLALAKLRQDTGGSGGASGQPAANQAPGAIMTFAAAGPKVKAKCAAPTSAPLAAAAAEPAVSATPSLVAGANGALKLEFTTRSLDGMVYYLGEALRSASVAGPGPDAPVQLWVWNTAAKRFEPWDLFEVRPGNGPIAVHFMHRQYAIPAACASASYCTDPEGRHTSFQAIALLNQVWGLQKEETQLPISPVVSVINP